MGPLKFVMLFGVATLLAGCSHTQPVPTPSYCDGWQPIFPTRADVEVISDPLTDQLLTHNKHGKNRCGWMPPQKATIK